MSSRAHESGARLRKTMACFKPWLAAVLVLRAPGTTPTSKHARERGQVLPLVAVCLTVLMGFAGMSVDVGSLQYDQRQQQTAADGAAVGGAEALKSSTTGCPNSSLASSAAIADAAENGFTNGSGGVTVTTTNPIPNGPFSGNSCAVEVRISAPHPTFFSKLFGLSGGETTQAVAALVGDNAGCIYLLSTTTSSNLSSVNINAPHCGMIMNYSGSENLSNSTLALGAITYAGTAPNISGATFPNATPAPALITADPCPDIAGCAYLANAPPSTSSCPNSGSYSNTTLSYGCYTSMDLTGNVALNPGTYVINGQFHLNGATVTGTGVTIYMTANVSDTNFSSANLTLSAPTTGSTAGVLFYRVPSQTSSIDMSNCTCNLSGLEYFPTTQVNYSGSGGGYSVLVFGSANFSTSQALDLGGPAAGQSIVRQVVLAQ